jgi:hypothetical protein
MRSAKSGIPEGLPLEDLIERPVRPDARINFSYKKIFYKTFRAAGSVVGKRRQHN